MIRRGKKKKVEYVKHESRGELRKEGSGVSEKNRDTQQDKIQRDIYEELRGAISRLPGIGGPLSNLLTEIFEKGSSISIASISRTFVQSLATIVREELRLFLKSMDIVGLLKRVLLDTSVELRVEVTFRDKSNKKEKEEKE